MICRSLQNGPLRRRSLHCLSWIFGHQASISVLEKERNRTGPDLANKVDEEPVRSSTAQFLPTRFLMCAGALSCKNRICGNHLATSILMPSSSWRMVQALLFEIPEASAISRIFSLRSASTTRRTFSMVSSEVAVFGLPERGASLVAVLPRWKSLNHLRIVDVEAEESPNVESSSSLIWSGVKPLILRYLITTRSFSFSIFIKSQNLADKFNHKTWTASSISKKLRI